MSHAILDHWWPVTKDYGLIRSDLEPVADARRRMHGDAGLKLSSTRLDAPLADCLSRLAPLSPAPTKELYLTTTFGWTAYFANGCRGSDPSLPMKQLAETLGTMAVRACATPEDARFPGVILEVFDTQQAGADKFGKDHRAVLSVRHATMTVRLPIGKQKKYRHQNLQIIHAEELDPPEGRAPVIWKLITNLPVATHADAVNKLEWYALRWKIETFGTVT